MIYDKYDGSAVSVNIENIDDKDPYTIVGAKAFLSCKSVYEIRLPDTICEIGDWAFAHMKELKRIIVPSKTISIGKDAFLDCDNIKEVVVYPDDICNQGLSYLLASCITILRSYDLLDFKMAAEQYETWYGLYDIRLLKFICQNDEQGFQPVIVGWFNDEGEEEQLKRYIDKTKKEKIRLSFLRLKYDACIDSDTKITLLSYLEKQIVNKDYGSTLGWEIIKNVIAGDIEYARLAVTNNLISSGLTLELIEYLNNNNSSTEIVAYLVATLDGKNSSIEQQFEL